MRRCDFLANTAVCREKELSELSVWDKREELRSRKEEWEEKWAEDFSDEGFTNPAGALSSGRMVTQAVARTVVLLRALGLHAAALLSMLSGFVLGLRALHMSNCHSCRQTGGWPVMVTGQKSQERCSALGVSHQISSLCAFPQGDFGCIHSVMVFSACMLGFWVDSH